MTLRHFPDPLQVEVGVINNCHAEEVLVGYILKLSIIMNIYISKLSLELKCIPDTKEHLIKSSYIR